MNFKALTQEQLKSIKIKENDLFMIEYLNKDYFNGEQNIEQGKASATLRNGCIYFNVTDPYGMEKLVMEAKILYKIV
jgi:hypothetical protein